MSRAITSLASRGWLARERNTADRRIEHLSLTARGRTHYSKLVDEAHAFHDEIYAMLGSGAMASIWQAIEHLDELER